MSDETGAGSSTALPGIETQARRCFWLHRIFPVCSVTRPRHHARIPHFWESRPNPKKRVLFTISLSRSEPLPLGKRKERAAGIWGGGLGLSIPTNPGDL